MDKTALIVGAGRGISAAFARALAQKGYRIALAARDPAGLSSLSADTDAVAYACDATRHAEVERLFDGVDRLFPHLDVVLYNPSRRLRAPLVELDPAEVEQVLAVTAFGGFLVGQQAARRMLRQGRGAIFFTGASASVKGYPLSAPFAMGKFALRGLAQSMSRELGPQGIHVAHFVIDGAVRPPAQNAEAADGDAMLDPAAIAQTYVHVLEQARSAWTWEVELRPWTEKF
jgi:NAD(P)-dependent dehydrogenase (short-subunit alcohol dehydrogenase family)